MRINKFDIELGSPTEVLVLVKLSRHRGRGPDRLDHSVGR